MSGAAVGVALRDSAAKETSTRLVLVVIAEECRKDGITWDRGLRMSTIARRAAVSERTARRAVKWLEEQGEIAVERHRGQGVANRFALLLYRRDEGLTPTNPFDRTPTATQDDDDRTPVSTQCPDTDVQASSVCPDTSGRIDRTPVTAPSLPVFVPSTTPTTSGGSATLDDYPLEISGDSPDQEAAMRADPPLTQPSLPGHPDPRPDPPEEERRLTPQQHAIGRVLAAFEQAGAAAPSAAQVAGLLRNLGGIQEVETLMQLIRGLVRRGELSVGALFAAIKTSRIRQGRGSGSSRPAPGHRGGGPRPAEMDDSRRAAIARIAREAAGGEG